MALRRVQIAAKTAPSSIEKGYWKGRIKPKLSAVALGKKRRILAGANISMPPMTTPTAAPTQMACWCMGCMFSMPSLKTSATAFQAWAAGAGNSGALPFTPLR